jgi:hypothetical protein
MCQMRIYAATVVLLSLIVQGEGFQTSFGTTSTTTSTRFLSPPLNTAGSLRRDVTNGLYISNGVGKLEHQCYYGSKSKLHMSNQSNGYMVSKHTFYLIILNTCNYVDPEPFSSSFLITFLTDSKMKRFTVSQYRETT